MCANELEFKPVLVISERASFRFWSMLECHVSRPLCFLDASLGLEWMIRLTRLITYATLLLPAFLQGEFSRVPLLFLTSAFFLCGRPLPAGMRACWPNLILLSPQVYGSTSLRLASCVPYDTAPSLETCKIWSMII